MALRKGVLDNIGDLLMDAALMESYRARAAILESALEVMMQLLGNGNPDDIELRIPYDLMERNMQKIYDGGVAMLDWTHDEMGNIIIEKVKINEIN